jgi:hypothetical protein
VLAVAGTSALAVGLMPAASAMANPVPVKSVSGSAYGVSAAVTKVLSVPATITVPPVPTVTLPSTGGSVHNSLVSINVPNLLSTGVLTVDSSSTSQNGSLIGSQSKSEVLAVAIPGVLSTDDVVSTCSSNSTGSTGSTTVVNLNIAGHSVINGAVPANTTINIPLVGSVELNEQIVSNTSTGTSITVNAIHVRLTGVLTSGDIIVAQSHCDVTFQPAPTTGTITGHIYQCNSGAQTTTEVPGGTIAVSQGSTIVKPAAPNPISYTVPSGTYTLTATPPSGFQFVACGNVSGGSTQNVTVPPGGSNSGGAFYVIPIPATANVFVGYADNWNSGPGFFPSPWSGSPNTTFVGNAEISTGGACMSNNCYDAGGIRIDNTSTIAETVSVTVDVGSNHYALWGNQSLAAGKTLVLTQTSMNGTYNFDTSDTQSGCTNSGQIPVVHVTINGTTTDLHDAGQILDTGGTDLSMCPLGTNEGHAWAQLTS